MTARTLLGVAVACGLSGATIAPAWPDDSFVLPHASWVTFKDCRACSEMIVLPNGLAMGRTPVTRAQFAVYAKETGMKQGGWGCVWQQPEFPQADTHPAVCLSWTDAQGYARWLARKTGKPYRLPTADELRMAAMGGETGAYWWGDSVGINRANCNGCGSRWDNKGTAPAGSFKPNAYGVFDAVGNVWQWTTTCHGEDCENHILVGGAWSSSPAQLRLTNVVWNDTGYRVNTYGFRMVRDAE